MSRGAYAAGNPLDFSLVRGGLLFGLWWRFGLVDASMGLLRKRTLVMAALCWVPLLLLSVLEGRLLGSTTVPFLHDVENHIKFLVAVPLLIAAEKFAHERMLHVATQFLDRELIPEGDRHRYDAALASMARLRDSRMVEGAILALVYGIGVLVLWRHYTALGLDTWYSTSSNAGSKLTWAGLWYGYLSVPIFQFLLLRWYFRIFAWARFLWQVSKIELKLVPTHPDHLGGLGVLNCAVIAFTPLAAAHGVIAAGYIAARILFLDAPLMSFKVEVAAIVAWVLCLVLVPLTAFSHRLWLTKLAGGREYGTLAQRYVNEFDDKWLRGKAPAGEALVGSADLQSLADLQNSVSEINSMRSTVFSRGSFATLAFATLAPIAPLALTVMPLEELLKKLFAILL